MDIGKTIGDYKNWFFGLMLAGASIITTWLLGLINIKTVSFGLAAAGQTDIAIPVKTASSVAPAFGQFVAKYFNGILPTDGMGYLTVAIGFALIGVIGIIIYGFLPQTVKPRVEWQKLTLAAVLGLAAAGVILGMITGLGAWELVLAMAVYAIFLIAILLLGLRLLEGANVKLALPEV